MTEMNIANENYPTSLVVDGKAPDIKGQSWQMKLECLLKKYVKDWEPLFGYLANSGTVGLVEYQNGEWICNKGDVPDVFWLIQDGQVDICGESGVRIKGRGPGEFIGEQSFLLLSQPCSDGASRSTGLQAHGTVKLITFSGSILTRMSVEIRAAWFEFLAHLINEKLIQASDERAIQMDERVAKARLLRRLCGNEALALVQMAVEGNVAQSPIRNAIVWFSDVAGFSKWSKGRAPNDVAAAMKILLGLQADLIHRHGGNVDKYMGDGLMAFWFIDGADDQVVPNSIRCATEVSKSFSEAIRETGMSELSLRIGLHCGDVCFGDFGTSDRIAVTLLGEPVNLAARYEQLAESEANPGIGPIRISDQLFELVSNFDKELAASICGPQSAKVKTDEFSVYWIEVTQ